MVSYIKYVIVPAPAGSSRPELVANTQLQLHSTVDDVRECQNNSNSISNRQPAPSVTGEVTVQSYTYRKAHRPSCLSREDQKMENGKSPAKLDDELAPQQQQQQEQQRRGYGHAQGSTGTSPSMAPLVTVQPPRREDLQPSYAQVLVGDDPAAHGWYGAMSE